MNFQKNILAINKVILEAKSILLITHKNPDGDTMGSGLAFYDLFLKIGKKAKVFCVDQFPEDFYFLPNFENVIHDIDLKDFDLAISVDCAADYMTGITDKFPDLFNKNFPLVNIDHHPSNKNFGTWNLVDTKAASTTLILTEMFQFLSIPVTYKMATCLMCGLYTDTGSFQHSNADSRALRGAAFLAKCGAAIDKISKNIFRTRKLEVLKLWGRVLSRIYQNEDKITISNVMENDLTDTNTNASDLSGVIDYINSVPNSKFSLLLSENKGKVKASFRTMREDVDVAKIAGSFGGGGHRKAAGFTVPGKLQKDVKWRIVKS